MPKRSKNWAKSFGPYGKTVRVHEDATSGILYGETRDPSLKSGYRAVSLRHRDRDRAEAWAKEQVAKLLVGDTTLRDPTPTVSRILGMYLAHRTARKGQHEQKADRRRAKMWTRFLGPRKDFRILTLNEWTRFIELRCAGAIDSWGLEVADVDRQPVRIGTAGADCTFLRAVLNWSCRWQDDAGRYLLREDPSRGYSIPTEKNPRRPVVDQDRYERVLAAAHSMQMRVKGAEKPVSEPSYLSALLILAHGTGRRISPILKLQYEDLRLHEGPHGSICWPADTDKRGKEWLVPINREVREVIDRILTERPGIGKAWLFPAPQNTTKHVSKDVASTWLLKAEKISRVPKQNGSLWHAYRRSWATLRKFMPDVDVAAAGGWSDVATLKQCYQHADVETMYRVVSEPSRIKEA